MVEFLQPTCCQSNFSAYVLSAQCWSVTMMLTRAGPGLTARLHIMVTDEHSAHKTYPTVAGNNVEQVLGWILISNMSAQAYKGFWLFAI